MCILPNYESWQNFSNKLGSCMVVRCVFECEVAIVMCCKILCRFCIEFYRGCYGSECACVTYVRICI